MDEASAVYGCEGATEMDKKLFAAGPALLLVPGPKSPNLGMKIRTIDVLHRNIRVPEEVSICVNSNYVGMVDSRERSELSSKSSKSTLETGFS